ncbi:hypothetical protein ACER0C_002042 [Sarotherodon galilaeus]
MVRSCCVIGCTVRSHDRQGNKLGNGLSFHSFPTWKQHEGAHIAELTKKRRLAWIAAVGRVDLQFSSISKCLLVCSRHFHSGKPAYEMDQTNPDWVPTLHMNSEKRRRTQGQQQRALVGGKHHPHPQSLIQKIALIHPGDQGQHSVTTDHDYCSFPEPSAEDLSKDLESLRKEIQELRVQREFGLQRFAGSDTDIQFYTRFPSYNHLMAFWVLIEPCIYKMIQASGAKSAANTDEERQLLQPIDEFFLFLVFLSVGLKERDLAHQFNIHQSTVSRIIATWTSFLATALGSQCIWLTRAEVQAYLPKEFKDFSDTQVILDCTELRCQTPSSPLLQSETYSSYKSHCTMKALVGIAPHGPVTFISDLYAGSVSDNELFKQSGIAEKLTEVMAVMVDKGFLINDCCKCKVYRPPFLSKQKKNQVKETQATVRLRLHVERVIRRIKQNKLFDGIITMSPVYNISQLFAVACMLSNYQNTALVKKQVK